MLKIPNILLLLILIILRITAPVPAFSQEEKEDTGESIESVKVDENALNSPEGLDKIIDAKINDDIWNSLKGDLPCYAIAAAQSPSRPTESGYNGKAVECLSSRFERVKRARGVNDFDIHQSAKRL